MIASFWKMKRPEKVQLVNWLEIELRKSPQEWGQQQIIVLLEITFLSPFIILSSFSKHNIRTLKLYPTRPALLRTKKNTSIIIIFTLKNFVQDICTINYAIIEYIIFMKLSTFSLPPPLFHTPCEISRYKKCLFN